LGQLQGFRRSEQGAAMVEFALVVPIMLMLYIGSVETSTLISMDRKLQSVAGALGDLVARSDTTILAADLEDYFLAASGIMTPYSTDRLAQVVMQVQILSDGTTPVVWSKQYHDGDVSDGTVYQAGDIFPLPAAMKNVVGEGFVIVAGGSYYYPPLYGFVFDKTINLYRENFFVPRFGGSITIN
jgi:Flp pilus assembly protein TadG